MKTITYMACDFSDKDLNDQRSFDEPSFREYLEKPETRDLIKRKLLLGTLSHKARSDYEKEINSGESAVGNPADYLLATNSASNCITDAYIRDHKLYITIQTLPLPYGVALEKLVDMGVDLLVSMSTELTIEDDNKYHIVNLFGLDHTTRPAFSTKKVEEKDGGSSK